MITKNRLLSTQPLVTSALHAVYVTVVTSCMDQCVNTWIYLDCTVTAEPRNNGVSYLSAAPLAIVYMYTAHRSIVHDRGVN